MYMQVVLRNCLVYSSETWPMKVGHEAELDANMYKYAQMHVWFCLEEEQEKYRGEGIIGTGTSLLEEQIIVVWTC